MFIETVECPQAEFRKRRFLLRSQEDLKAILSTSASQVLINTAHGTQDGDATAITTGAIPDSVRREVQDAISSSMTMLRDSMAGLRNGSAPDIAALGPASGRLSESTRDYPTALHEMTRLKTKDEGTFLHSIAVGGLMAQVGRSFGMSEDDIIHLGVAGMLHDIGKILIPSAIIGKKTGLTDEERRIIRSHPELGYQLLKPYPEIAPVVLDVCRYHHEALDGGGYPHKLRGAEITLPVRIASVCDVFDALTSARPYKRPWSTKAALNFLFEHPAQFDAKVVLRLAGTLEPLGERRN